VNTLYIQKKDGSNATYDVSQMVQSIEWSGTKYGAARSLKVPLVAKNPKGELIFYPAEGDNVFFYHNKQELFRGTVISKDINKDGIINITAYDVLRYLLENKDTLQIKNEKASDFIKWVCKLFGIPVGDIADTKYVIKYYSFEDKTLYDMFIMALEMTRKQTGVRYYLYVSKGRIQVIKRIQQSQLWVLESGVNILDFTFSSSMENMATQVKLVKDNLIATVSDANMKKIYGTLQHFETISEDLTQAQLQQRARTLLKQLARISKQFGLDTLGIPDVIAGGAVHVIENTTKTKGIFYVEEDTHRFEGNLHTMNLKLEYTDDLPEVS
jgi:hypothetical protein